jgi:hypothetical protein
MKNILGLLFISSLSLNAEAAQFALAKIDPNTWESGAQKIKEAVATDDSGQEILPFDKDQSFLLKGKNQQKIGYFIPVKFNSRSYKNTICRLYFGDLHHNLTYTELFAEKNDDDVVSSCVGIEAISIREKASDEAYYLALMRYRTVNTYGSRGIVVNYKNGTLLYDKKINSCITNKGETNSMNSLKKKLPSCM